eukprot:CAMPEP_0174292836 /NCGR_PEP_ID=MMETSP0809-20121228/36650_1 /TAXON_ID=73025 ORGANISM="Eutreptiella gymnastica-like, Strain CCMP1594" /NCGR_SAMPLE_ID=MMETSP0809 /ASSEMBLY_ACC=CAM_ASM_000658 /LENGTH=119 /DNA_ID=CAMNT_0015393157 /DNA_START=178 /DNA_END=533 /DNA_ORIENTATION=-
MRPRGRVDDDLQKIRGGENQSQGIEKGELVKFRRIQRISGEHRGGLGRRGFGGFKKVQGRLLPVVTPVPISTLRFARSWGRGSSRDKAPDQYAQTLCLLMAPVTTRACEELSQTEPCAG